MDVHHSCMESPPTECWDTGDKPMFYRSNLHHNILVQSLAWFDHNHQPVYVGAKGLWFFSRCSVRKTLGTSWLGMLKLRKVTAPQSTIPGMFVWTSGWSRSFILARVMHQPWKSWNFPFGSHMNLADWPQFCVGNPPKLLNEWRVELRWSCYPCCIVHWRGETGRQTDPVWMPPSMKSCRALLGSHEQ